MEDRIRAHMDQLFAGVQPTRASVELKEEMIQNISHDLKTPIATIKSYGESIKDGICSSCD